MRINLGNSTIIHFFVMPAPDKAMPISPFQGFMPGIFSDEYFGTLSKLLCLPMNVTEAFMTREELISYRCELGTPSIILLDTEAFTKIISAFKKHPFVCITCIGKEFEFVKNLDLDFKYPPNIIGIDELADVNISDFNIYLLDDFIVERLNQALENNDLPSEYTNLLEEKGAREKVEEKLDLASRCHAVTRPNDAVLVSLGYKFENEDHLIGGADKEVFIDAMLESSHKLKEFVKGHKDDTKSELIVYSPSIFTHLYRFKSHFWNQISRQLKDKRAKEFIMNGIFKNRSYSGMQISIDSEDDVDKLMRNKLVSSLYGIRKFELAYTNLAICSLAVANMCPAVRVPNAINFYNGLLKDLESLSISSAQRAQANFNRKHKELVGKIRNEIGEKLIDFISEHDSLTLCTDVPLEWVRVNKIPLMFTHEISKIHTTMGNQLLKTSMNFSSFTLEQDDLNKITVIRSFSKNDPIKYTLEEGLRHYIEIDNGVELSIMDVDNKEQMLEALNKVDTPILIFDCHGNHGGDESHGWLQIGDDKVDTWELQTIVPPIIILSACLTSAISGSHASVANGLLENGALTVLGTLLPVDATKSAAFVGRIAYRLTGYLNALKKLGVDYLTWRKFVSDFFRMSFCTDVLGELRDTYEWINQEQYEEIHIQSNFAINMCNREWLDVLVQLISEKSGKTQEEVHDKIQEIGFVETMNYSQIGRPESIIIQL
ncbi:CHAT domain-containing protein [Photobacterium damselae]|uniref:CHAT domain-containing protein n=1 Tax=Photobacterium damselae TaxID=38293 RepID=UPI004067B780